ncbi:uncharacterized protein LOC124125182 [Haliotis rufescens]|uniref:uncharacterized protein LOC124125182 n=1 Tax=Haliotis rufescens TaxID=6454 RepID=UPI00201F6031|nr:uncharacterized protein LOC124125182 [Haliotis rufescens]
MSDTASRVMINPNSSENGIGTENHCLSRARTWGWIAVSVSLCVNVILLVLLVPLVCHREETQTNTIMAQSAEVMDKSAVCTNCRHFRPHVDLLQLNSHLQVVQTKHGNICCLRQAEGLWRLLNLMNIKSMMMQQQQSIGRPLSLPSSAHLYLDTDTASHYKWTDEDGYGAAHVTTKVKLVDGRRIQVTEAGYYNIYSFLTLKTRSELVNNINVKHSITRTNRQNLPDTDVILYKSVEMCRTSETFTNSYLDGVVKLNSKDEIDVQVSNTSALYKFPPSNFFGLHLVRSI